MRQQNLSARRTFPLTRWMERLSITRDLGNRQRELILTGTKPDPSVKFKLLQEVLTNIQNHLQSKGFVFLVPNDQYPIYNQAFRSTESTSIIWGPEFNHVHASCLFLLKHALEKREFTPLYPARIYRQPMCFLLEVILISGILGAFYDSLWSDLDKLTDLVMREIGISVNRIHSATAEANQRCQAQNQFQTRNQNLGRALDAFKTVFENFHGEIRSIWHDWQTTLGSGGKTRIMEFDFSLDFSAIRSMRRDFTTSTIEDLVEPSLFSDRIKKIIESVERFKLEIERCNQTFSELLGDQFTPIPLNRCDKVVELLKLAVAQLNLRGCIQNEVRPQGKGFEYLQRLLIAAESVTAFLTQAYQLANHPDEQDFERVNLALVRVLVSRATMFLAGFNHIEKEVRATFYKWLMGQRIDVPQGFLPSIELQGPRLVFQTLFETKLREVFESRTSRSEQSPQTITSADSSHSHDLTIFDKPFSLLSIFHEFFTLTISELIATLSAEEFNETTFWSLFSAGLNIGAVPASVALTEPDRERIVSKLRSYLGGAENPTVAFTVISQWQVFDLIAKFVSAGYLNTAEGRKLVAEFLREVNSIFATSSISSLEEFLNFLWARIRQRLAQDDPGRLSFGFSDFSFVEDSFEDVLITLYHMQKATLHQPADTPINAEDLLLSVRQNMNALQELEAFRQPIILGSLTILVDFMLAANPTTCANVDEESEKELDSIKLIQFIKKFCEVEVSRNLGSMQKFAESDAKRFVKVAEALGATKDELVGMFDSAKYRYSDRGSSMEITVTLPFRGQLIEVCYHIDQTKQARIKDRQRMMLRKVQDIYSQLISHILAEGQQLIKGLGLTVQETRKVLKITGWDPIKTSRAKRIIENIGYQEFIYLHEFCENLLRELLEDADLIEDPIAFEVVIELLNAKLPAEIKPARIKACMGSSGNTPEAEDSKDFESKLRSQKREQSILTDYFKRIYGDLTVMSALKDHQRLKDFLCQLREFKRYNLTADEVLSIYSRNKRLLYWQVINENYRFEDFWKNEFEEFLLWLGVMDPDEIRSILVSYPSILEPGLLEKKYKLVSFVKSLHEQDDVEVENHVIQSVKRCKEIILAQVEEIDVKLTSLASEIWKTTRDYASSAISSIVDYEIDQCATPVEENAQYSSEINRLKRQLLLYAPELVFYSGNLTRFGAIISYGLRAAERGWLTGITVHELTALNSYNPNIIRVALELFETYGTTYNFKQFLHYLNQRLREHFGLLKGQQIKTAIDEYLEVGSYDDFKSLCVTLICT